MKRTRWVVLVLVVAVGLLGACRGGMFPKKPSAGVKKASPSTKKRAGVLPPEWAPKNPSPEFLRAWKVLTPIPLEALFKYVQGDKAKEAVLRKSRGTWPAQYEFFGTLSDEQIRRFLNRRQIRIPVSSLTPKQRAAMERIFSEWRRVMAGTEEPDILASLYKCGARQDFSNVEAGFDRGQKFVHTKFWVRVPSAEVRELCTGFACI